jgi:hypothetical protein
MGRPRIYDTVEEIEKEIDDYFFPIKREYEDTFEGRVESRATKSTEMISKPSVTGLALALGFADKSSLYEYRDREEFSYPIKRALTMIELKHEENLFGATVAGSIFALKNMGWKDKTEQEHSGELGIKQITGMVIK